MKLVGNVNWNSNEDESIYFTEQVVNVAVEVSVPFEKVNISLISLEVGSSLRAIAATPDD